MPDYTTPPPYNNGDNNWWLSHQGIAFARNEFFADGPEGKNRGVAALLAIFLGGLGIHYFYMDKSTAGVIFLLVSLCSCGSIPATIGFIQGIYMCCITNRQWRQKYIATNSTLPLF